MTHNDEARRVADAVLVGALRLHLRGSNGRRGRLTTRVPPGQHQVSGGSVAVAPGEGVTIGREAGTAVLVTVGRFADEPTVDLGRVAADDRGEVRFPRDRSSTVRGGCS